MPQEERSQELVESHIQEIIDLAFGHVGNASRRGLTATLHEFHRIDPEFIPLTHRMLTTGTPTGKMAAKHSIAYLYGHRDRRWARAERGQTVESICEQAKSGMIRAWAIGNVEYELDLPTTGSFSNIVASANDHMNQYRGDQLPVERDEYYWRGLAALVHVITTENGEKEWEAIGNGVEFIGWAAHRDDLAVVVATARKFKTIDTDHLDHLIAQQRMTTPSLREGIL